MAIEMVNNTTMTIPSVGTPVSYDFAYRQTSTEGKTPRPSLTTFRAPPYIHVESWDYTADFYDDEILAGERLADQCDAVILRPADLSRRTCRRLQQSFVENFLRWTPIFDQQTCISALEQGDLDSFASSDAPTCLAFLILALGAISEDRNNNSDNLTPGLEYFARGSRILEHLSLRIGNLATLQFPLPQFEEEDSGFYFFLAQISLRKFLTQTLEVVGYFTGQVIFAPVVIGELRKQVREWYDHLPSVVQFPIDSTPLFDSRKSFLRVQYIALHVVLGWPSVLKILEVSEEEAGAQDDETIVITRDHARHCIKSSALLLSIADEQLMGRKMGTHFTLYPTFACFATLLIAFDHPALAFIEETKQEQHIRNGYDVLQPWAHLPLIRRGLERARILMQQNNLAHIFHAYADELPQNASGVSPPVATSHNWRSPRAGFTMKP
ncbi:unnamed protein product [Alternaria alternata]